jgi:threonine-phosphate decarboxylase
MMDEISYWMTLMINNKPNYDCLHGGVHSVNPALVQFDFSSNVNPLGISKDLLSNVCRELGRLCTTYPDPSCRELKNGILDYLGLELDPKWLLVGNGATELIHIFARTFVRGKVVISAPTFCEYELSARRVGATIKFVPLKNWEHDPEIILKESKEGCGAVFLCNPNNPTGILSTESVRKIIENIDPHTQMFLDECFIELVEGDGKKNSMIEMVSEYKNLVILRSMTKSFSLAGIRLGYCVCNPNLINLMLKNMISWNVNGVAQKLGMLVLKDKSYLENSRRLIRRERNFMVKELKKKTKFSPMPSDVNYFLIDVSDRSSTEVRNYLLTNRGILVRDCRTFTGMGLKHIRVAVKKHMENAVLIDALSSIES